MRLWGADVSSAMVVAYCGLVPSPTRRGRYKSTVKCDGSGAWHPVRVTSRRCIASTTSVRVPGLARPTRHRNPPTHCLRYAWSMNPPAHDLETIRARLCELLEPRPEILDAYLFGSTARGAEQTHSDLDIAVFIDEDASDQGGFGYQAALTADLMAGLGTNAVDVVILNLAPPLLYHRVLRDGIRLISRNLQASTTREAQALSRYCDFLPQLDKIDAASREAPPSRVTEP